MSGHPSLDFQGDGETRATRHYLWALFVRLVVLRYNPVVITPDERERMNELCKRIMDEKDPVVFDQLCAELNELLKTKHQRIHPEHGKSN